MRDRPKRVDELDVKGLRRPCDDGAQRLAAQYAARRVGARCEDGERKGLPGIGTPCSVIAML